ncbi:MAG: hypothetical protein Q9M94_06455 [Candidatus Gracilibacteria bacterium]|nr:hypothetical protein [Candidatus Gracilibacteria bacterium]
MKENRANMEEKQSEMKKSFSALDDDTRAKLKQENKIFKEEIKKIREEHKNKKLDEEAREVLKEKMEEVRKANYEKMEDNLAGNEEALNAIKSRKEVFEKNRELRKQNTEKRIEFRGERNDMVVKYKTAFISKLGTRIEKINDSKLEIILPKIDTLVEKMEKNTRLTEEKRDMIISQLIALKEIIEEKLENSAADVDIDIEELLN